MRHLVPALISSILALGGCHDATEPPDVKTTAEFDNRRLR
jgi:hypothetical protein